MPYSAAAAADHRLAIRVCVRPGALAGARLLFDAIDGFQSECIRERRFRIFNGRKRKMPGI
jgi:hypothetical protein